jgi:transposase-like protein
LVRSRQGSARAKERLELILETLGGRRTIAEACQALGLSEAQFHRVRERALEGALEALEPRPVGRPRQAVTPEGERIRELEAELREIQVELMAAEIREELALVMPKISVTESIACKKKRHAEPS